MEIPCGTLIFFGGRCLESRLIAFGTTSLAQKLSGHWISHVGLTFKYYGQTLLIESTVDNSVPCCILGAPIRGVQAHTLPYRLDKYDGDVWLCEPKAVDAARIKHVNARLTNLCTSKQILGTPYDTLGALATGLDPFKHWWNFAHNKFFCSELCTYLLQHVGIKVDRIKDTPGLITPAELARNIVQYGYQPLRPWTKVKRVGAE